MSATVRGADGTAAAMVEAVPCSDGSRFRLRFETMTGEWRHGVWLAVQDGALIINEQQRGQWVVWQDAAPQEFSFHVQGSDGLLRLYNVWQPTDGRRRSQSNDCGILLEPLPGGQRFRCRDYGVEPDFRHLVFTLPTESSDASSE